jgi:hypothetical protein
LDQLPRGRGLAPRHIGDLAGLLQTLQQGDVALLHFSCHHAFARAAPNTSRILLRNQPFEPVFVKGHAGRSAIPPAFLNVCRTDGQVPLYTTMRRRAASLLTVCAGAVIGSLGEVTDTSASTYAQEFYRAALSEYTLGQARDAIRGNRGDPPGSPAPSTTPPQQQ